MHDVSYTVALYLAMTSAALLTVISICRQLKTRLPPSVNRWAHPHGVLDRCARGLTVAALLFLLLWLVRIIR